MSKVLRLFKNGNNNISDWQEQNNYVYDSSNRSQIDDTIKASKFHDITSIPSPFARMQLVKDAFREIVKTGDLDADNIYGRTVSDTLDVGELFFNIDKFSDKLEIIPVDLNAVADNLKNDGNDDRHHAVGDTLQKFLLSDAEAFNFNRMNKIYLLRYIYGDTGMQVIGATSPRTLFFSTANQLSNISDEFSFGQDKPFDLELAPLYKRDFEYVKLWFYLRNTIPNFAKDFKEVYDYLSLVRDTFDNDKRTLLDNINSVDEFEQIEAGTQIADHVEVLNYPILKKKLTACVDSDFEIDTKLLDESQRPYPLVLPVDAGINYANLKYTEDKWGSENKAPFYDDKELDKRKLPKPGNLKQPYLTISDFMEDYIIKVPHTMNGEHFFTGNVNFRFDEKQVSYLLPLKKKFFDYFSVEELMGTVGNQKMIEMETKPSNGVRVTIRIPIRGNGQVKCVVYSRTYYDNDAHDCMPNREQNIGAVREFNFTGLLMPNYKFNVDKDAFYTLSCICWNNQDFEYHLFKGGNEIEDIPYAVRNPCDRTSESYKAKNYTVERHTFDFIQVSDEGRSVTGVIVPIFRNRIGNSQFNFSVDLGTSNTLVEYAVPNANTGRITPKVFGFDKADSQVCQMFVQTIEVKETGERVPQDLTAEISLIDKDFIPEAIGDGYDFGFPNRTVLSAKRNIDWSARVDAFGLVNIPFTYDKRKNLTYNQMYFDIKWGKDLASKTILEKYIDCLMLMIRNKVVLNDGDLSKTQITWFYPISMEQARLADLKRIWDEAYKKYFNANGVTSSVTESSAPVKAFYETNPNASQIVSVDIGGGTTDMAFSKMKGEVSYVTSFRFATNDLFQTPFSKVNLRNGIVDHFKESFHNVLQNNGQLSELLDVYNNEDNQDAVNMASFLFSLKSNSLIMKNDINVKSVDFLYNLQVDDKFKIVFLLYYSSIIYHLAKIIKVANQGKVGEDVFMPRHLTFSGNGSKIISALTPDISGVLTDYTKLLIEKVSGLSCPNLCILGISDDATPKEATCKGGLMTDGNIDDRGKSIILKATGEEFADLSEEYNSVKKNYEMEVVKEVEHFFDFILVEMNKDFNFSKMFQMSQNSLVLAKEICKQNLDTFLTKALDNHRELENKQIEETLFFYPIKGALNAISEKIYLSLHTND